MKYQLIAPMALSALLVSCAQKSTQEDYDVSNPYAAPDYGDAAGATAQADSVNPAYDAPAVYEDTAPAYTAPATSPASSAGLSGGASGSSRVHTVVKGDSLWAIAKKYNVTVDGIKALNNMKNDTAVLGARLQIPASR